MKSISFQSPVYRPCLNKNIIEVSFLLQTFIVSPFLSVLLAVYLIYCKRHVKLSVMIVVAFYGLVGYTFLPIASMDITRHYSNFEELTNVNSFSDFIFYQSLSEKPDLALDFIFWGIGKLINTHQIVGFVGAACYYGLGLGVLLNWRKNLHSKSSFNNFLLPSLMFLALAQVTEFSGMRQGNAILLFLLIVTIPDERLEVGKKCFCLIFPCLLHFSMYPLWILYICSCFLNYRVLIIISICLLMSFFFFLPLMSFLMTLLSSLGSIGSAISAKIDDYLFQGEVEVALYSGSILRFYIILLMILVFPIIAFKLNKMRRQFPSFILHLHYWGILFFSYLIFSSSSFVLSRNLMMFKMFGILYFTYALFSCHLGKYFRRLLICMCLLVVLSGPFSLILGKEYRVLNPKIFYSNIIELLSIKTLPGGY